MSDAQYRQFLDHFADDFFLHDDVGNILDVNAQACASMGYAKEELLAMRVQDFSHDHSNEELLVLWRGITIGTNAVVNNMHQHRDGSIYPVEVHISCQKYQGRKCFFTMARHIKERMQREAKISQLNTELKRQFQQRTRQWQDSTRLLDAVMRGTSDIVFVKDLQGRYIFANPAADKLMGVAPGGLIGLTDADFLEGNNGFADDDVQVFTHNEPIVNETFAVIHGERRTFQSIKSQYRNEHDEVIGLLGISRDITHVHKAAQQLRLSYDSLRRAERQARIGSWTLDLTTGSFSASEMMFEMNGADPNGPQLTPTDLKKLMKPDEHARVVEHIDSCIKTGQPYDLDVMHFTPGRGWFPVSIRGQADRDAEGNIISISGTVQDLSERVDAKQRLEALADNLPSGAIYRIEGEINNMRMTYVSAGVERLMGISAAAIMSNRDTYLNAVHPNDREAYINHAHKTHVSNGFFDHRFRIVRPDGGIRWLRCRSAPHRRPQGMAWDGIMLDITREHEAELALQAAKNAAEAAERAKADFLATMSHEIRTPMNTVIGMTRLVQQTALTQKQRNYLEKIELSANALLSIINDILDFSKIEAGMLALEQADFQLDDILETVSAITTLRAEEKDIEVVYAIAPDVPRQLRGDPLRLAQVLNNLVSNAIKFTHTGEVIVAIKNAPIPSNQQAVATKCMLEFSIKDTGIGLSDAQIQQLFHPFSQADSQTTRRYGGTGLGLAICRRLVELMEGNIDVTSTPGVGSTFRFTAALQSSANSLLRPPFNKMSPAERVLIVDDNASAREILSAMVRNFGMHVSTAKSGEQALQLLHKASKRGIPYNLVLMDWRMPGMDGLEVARRIREEAHLSTTPAVLMVTAYGREDVLRRAEALSLQGLLIKPVTESVLFNAIAEALKPQSNHQTAKQHQALPRPSISTLYPQLTGAKILVVDDNALNREVASDFLKLANIEVHLASDGAEALKMLRKQSFDAVLMDIHMPHMDGLSATRAIRHELGLLDLPVIALTAQARVEDRILIEEAGMNAHLTKPIDDSKLYATLQAWMDKTAPMMQPQPPQAAFTDQLSQHFQHNSDRFRRVMLGFVRDFSKAPEQLRKNLEQVNWSQLGFLAHTLKGSLGYLDAHALATQAGELERLSYAIENSSTKTTKITDLMPQLQQLTPLFATELERLLNETSQAAGHAAQPANVSSALNAEYLHDQLQQLEHLISEADYAAVAALESLGNHINAPLARDIFLELQQYVEDVETLLALEALQRLRQQLQYD